MYIDTMVAPVKTARKDEYATKSAEMAQMFKRNGALSYTECWADDVPPGKITSFPMAVALEADETCAVCFISYPDKATRDACMGAVMSDARADALMKDMPLDGARMIFGGFKAIVAT